MTEDKNTGQPDEETHVMSHEEVKDYAGLTLNEQGEEEGRAEENSYIRVKTIHLLKKQPARNRRIITPGTNSFLYFIVLLKKIDIKYNI